MGRAKAEVRGAMPSLLGTRWVGRVKVSSVVSARLERVSLRGIEVRKLNGCLLID